MVRRIAWKTPASDSPQLLGQCVARLKQARIELQEKSLPQVDGLPEAGAASEAGKDSSADAAKEGIVTEAGKPGVSKHVSAMFAQKLELDAQQAEELEQIVCALKELRISLFDDYAHEQTSLDTMWQELAALRKDLAADLEQLLGEERYRQFREVGGIGAMGSAVDCSAMGSSPGDAES